MPRRELNNANAVKRMTDFFGHSNDLITLSQVSTYNSFIFIYCPRGRQYTAFLAMKRGGRIVFSVNE